MLGEKRGIGLGIQEGFMMVRRGIWIYVMGCLG